MATPRYTDLAFFGAKITGLPAAANAGEAVVYEQLQAAVEGIAWKDSGRVGASTNLNLAAPGATIDGVTMATSDRFLARGQTTQSQNGIYIWNGSATPATRAADASTFAELEAAVVTIEEGTDAGVTFRQTQVNGAIDSSNVIWTNFGTSAPAASETTAGIAELATQAETDAGTDDARIVTPLKLANHSNRKRKTSGTIGDGSATQFDITHNFGTRSVFVSVYRNSGNFDEVLCDISRPTDTNTVRLNFATAPTTNQFAYTILA